MRSVAIEPNLHKLLIKISRKDKKLYEIVENKMFEIATNADVDHYKNLQSRMQDFRRVHVDNCFVLIFKYDEASDKVLFYDLEHHDKIYR